MSDVRVNNNNINDNNHNNHNNNNNDIFTLSPSIESISQWCLFSVWNNLTCFQFWTFLDAQQLKLTFYATSSLYTILSDPWIHSNFKYFWWNEAWGLHSPVENEKSENEILERKTNHIFYSVSAKCNFSKWILRKEHHWGLKRNPFEFIRSKQVCSTTESQHRKMHLRKDFCSCLIFCFVRSIIIWMDQLKRNISALKPL